MREGQEELGRRQVSEAHVAFAHNTYLHTPDLLSAADLKLLHEAGLIEKPPTFFEQEVKVDAPVADRYPLSIEEYLKRCEHFDEKWADRDIKVKDWMCEESDKFDPDFVDFISSTHQRFCEMKPYEPFYLYLRQKMRWMDENHRWADFTDVYERETFTRKEYSRIKAHTLYFGDKYCRIKDIDEPRFVATLSHAFQYFLLDQGRSLITGKARQIGDTTGKGIYSLKVCITRRSSSQVFIAHDKESGETILEDKIKFVYGHLEPWLQLPALNDADGAFRITFDQTGQKGVKKTMSSSVGTRTPAVNAINSRSPDIILIDEAGGIPMYDRMVFEGRPALVGMDHKTGRIRMKRQLIAWSTGGLPSGKGVYEREFKGSLTKWREGNHDDFMVPIFLDWTCRPGVTVQNYLNEQSAYAAGNKEGHTHMSLQERMVQFRQHWPSSVDDMFNASKATIIPWGAIIEQEDRINKWQSKGAFAVNGKFVPVYGTEEMPEGSALHRKVIGANWVPSADNDYMSPCTMWQGPDRNWIDRYYQGTDPITLDAGMSCMGSAIYDAEFGTISCIVNHRTDDPNDAFLQTALMGMHYAQKGSLFVPELVERNISKGYQGFKYGPWLDFQKRSLVRAMQLPDHLRGALNGANPIGLMNSGNTKGTIIGLLKDMLEAHRTKIFIRPIIEQLRHFVATPTKGIMGATWATEDKTKYQDDLVDAMAFAYICRLCFSNKMPMKIDDFEAKKKAMQPRRLRRNGAGGVYWDYTPSEKRA
jgi:hypothetical protein